MRIDVLTIFPQMVSEFCSYSLLGRAQAEGVLDLRCHDVRDGATGVHRAVDDAPFGGGAGMVMAPEPIANVIDHIDPPRPLFYLGPAGRKFDQRCAVELAELAGFTLLCGRYEGVDQRALDMLCDDELSIGDYVLSGGEVAALVVIEAVARLQPGMMGNDTSATEESFGLDGLLEYPQFTRPAQWRGVEVPEVLRSGDHQRVQRWRLAQALDRTRNRRPDLMALRGGLSDEDRAVLDEFGL